MKKFRFLFVTILAILIPLLCTDLISYEVVQLFFSVSIIIKSLFVIILPFIIFCFIFSALTRLNAKKAIRFVLLLVSCVFISNLIAIFVGYFIGKSFISFINFTLDVQEINSNLYPLWQIKTIPIIRNEHALVIGFIAGIIASIYPSDVISNISLKLQKMASDLLKYFFIPMIPLFVLGSMFKLSYDGLLSQALNMYGSLLLVVILSQVLYLSMLYLIAAKFNLYSFITYIRNMLPATITAFSTASSASALPVLIVASSKNMHSENVAKVIVPSCINIHTLGSALAITILCIFTANIFGMQTPSFSEFYLFALFYAISKFAVAGVPGGVILVVAPLISSYLHFSSDMLALITGVYVLFDPFGTATNVTANGAFSIIFHQIAKKLHCSID